MTLPRSQLIDPQVTPYYHCTSRCVRRAFLCGQDPLTGFDFEHRRQWIENRLQALARIFAIDLCGYAVMSNHYHVVLHINSAQAQAWSDGEVIAHWSKVYRVPDWFQVLSKDNSQHSQRRVAKTVALWRKRLADISWFMRSINEPLARWANREDQCTGRFWEGRFHSQALLDNEAVLHCLVYVDLNPIRAGLSATPETSDHTSIKARIEKRDQALAPMATSAEQGFALPLTQSEYLALVDWSGRQWRADKRGCIDPDLPPIFDRLAHPPDQWLDTLRHLMTRYCRAIGNSSSLLKYRTHLGQQRLNGLSV